MAKIRKVETEVVDVIRVAPEIKGYTVWEVWQWNESINQYDLVEGVLNSEAEAKRVAKEYAKPGDIMLIIKMVFPAPY